MIFNGDHDVDALRAKTLDDEDLRRLSLSISRQSDAGHTVATPRCPCAQRLQHLVGSHDQEIGHPFNVKVYLSPTVNAFAMADGSIRIFSGLMDMIDDDGILSVIGLSESLLFAQFSQQEEREAKGGKQA